MMSKKVGVVGYSGKKFDEILGTALFVVAMDIVKSEHGSDLTIVSGLTDLGIPSIAYKYAFDNDLKTVGVACSQAEEYDCFDVDEKHIVGDEWGDESETFLDMIDIMIRIGGGDQSMEEVESAKKKDIDVYEYDLPHQEEDDDC